MVDLDKRKQPIANGDIFRDTWVRYLGYANEVGESFRPVIPPRLVRLSYYAAFSYVLADTADKSFREFWKDKQLGSALHGGGDALVWQTLASVIIPGFTINRICALSQRVLAQRAPKVSPRARMWIAVGISLASIPVIVKPIDVGTSLLMDCTYRRWFKAH